MRTVNIIMTANNNKKTLSLMYIFLGRMATILKRATATTTTTTTTTIAAAAAAAAAANMVSRASSLGRTSGHIAKLLTLSDLCGCTLYMCCSGLILSVLVLCWSLV